MNDPLVESPALREVANPYAPPLAEPEGKPAHSRRLPWIPLFVGAQGMALLLDVGAMAGWPLAAQVDHLLADVARVAAALFGLDWLRRQWERLPARLRAVKHRAVTPNEAAWRNLIPFYQLYWMFAVNAALCNGINALLLKKGRPRMAPTWLSVICPITVLVEGQMWKVLQGVVLVIANFAFGVMWIMYMLGVERALAHAKEKRSSLLA
ncbi:MAG TPA: hypothetical protein VNO21_16250 [Polyangiaceae bacterium]|nr:hypothetical protein [Polyangiaceae bacterium]